METSPIPEIINFNYPKINIFNNRQINPFNKEMDLYN